VDLAVIFEMPDSIAMGVQRKGRASRDGRPLICIFIFGVASYIAHVTPIFNQHHVSNGDDDDDNTNKIVINTLVEPPQKKNSKQAKITKSMPCRPPSVMRSWSDRWIIFSRS